MQGSSIQGRTETPWFRKEAWSVNIGKCSTGLFLTASSLQLLHYIRADLSLLVANVLGSQKQALVSTPPDGVWN